MLRRLLIASTLAVALAAPQAATASSLPDDYVPSPGHGLASSPRAKEATGGAAPPSGDYSASPAGGIGVTSGSPEPTAPTPRPRRRRTRLGPGAKDVPRAYLRRYRGAARRHGIDWTLLAAIGKVESDHGRSTAPGVRSGLNFADCCAGVMQICTVKSCGRVWQFYAVDADRDGRASVYDPPDAIEAAAALVADLQATFTRRRFRLILAAYNAGPSAVSRFNRVPAYPETQAYVTAAVRYMKLLRPSPKR